MYGHLKDDFRQKLISSATVDVMDLQGLQPSTFTARYLLLLQNRDDLRFGKSRFLHGDVFEAGAFRDSTPIFGPLISLPSLQIRRTLNRRNLATY